MEEILKIVRELLESIGLADRNIDYPQTWNLIVKLEEMMENDYHESPHNYNFQIQEPGVDWENTEAKTVAFSSRKEAVTFAYSLSYMTNREIRFSEGDWKTSSGTYIKM